MQTTRLSTLFSSLAVLLLLPVSLPACEARPLVHIPERRPALLRPCHAAFSRRERFRTPRPRTLPHHRGPRKSQIPPFRPEKPRRIHVAPRQRSVSRQPGSRTACWEPPR